MVTAIIRTNSMNVSNDYDDGRAARAARPSVLRPVITTARRRSAGGNLVGAWIHGLENPSVGAVGFEPTNPSLVRRKQLTKGPAHRAGFIRLTCGNHAPEMPRDAWESLHGGSRKWFPEQRPRSPAKMVDVIDPGTGMVWLKRR